MAEFLSKQELDAFGAERSKPNPDIFEKALAAVADRDPNKALMIADTIYGAEAAP
jgi:beta-phosphoglucomutase-like phosphatase (HAD superfamily)